VGAVTVQPVGATVTTAGPQRTQTCDGTWHTVATPLDKRIDRRLYGVAAVSATDAWAVGQGINSSKPGKPLIERWDGTTWTIMASPLPSGAMNGVLHAVSVVSATDVWAVGVTSSSTLIEHWDGTSWSVVDTPGVAGGETLFLTSAVALSTTNVWAVGEFFQTRKSRSRTLTDQWNGSSWAVVASPNVGSSHNELFGVAAAPSQTLWAVGTVYQFPKQRTLIERKLP